MHSKSWQNLAIAAVLVIYLIQLWVEHYRLFWFFGADFTAYWSAGHIANQWGYINIYDIDLVTKIEHFMRTGSYVSDITFSHLPMPYLPILVLPFQLIALFTPATGFYIWFFINLFVGASYLSFFTKNIVHPHKKTILALFILSFPFFQNLFWGQINLILMISLGEFIRATENDKEVQAGMWLSLLILKPQSIVFIVPALFLARKMKPLFGLAIGTALLLGISLLLTGIEGIRKMLDLWFGLANTIPATVPEAMGNWRMVGVFINHLSNSNFGTYLSITLSLLTIVGCGYLWITTFKLLKKHFYIVILNIFAATGIATWHSHVHMAVILIPVLLALSLEGTLPQKILSLWVFLPPAFYLSGLILMIFVKDHIYQGVLYGPAQLILYLLLLVWSTQKLLYFKNTAN